MSFLSTFKLSWVLFKFTLRALIVTLWLTPAHSLPGFSETPFSAREAVFGIKSGPITLEQFRAEIILHRKRVQFLFQHVARSRGFDLEAIKLYSQLHDLPKVMNLQQLRSYGYNNERTILERLFEFYGKRDITMDIDDQLKLELVLEDLNDVEKNLKKESVDQNKLFKDFTKIKFIQLKQTEHVIDIVDTGLSRASEMGANSYLASSRLYKDGKFEQAAFAFSLEQFHRSLSGPIWNNKRRRSGLCRRFFH